ncbi:flagellar filament capping protein FliD [Laribacter hongkongensis]|uniref:flagellar filament capping protein FliD n=1 Tax=Laribacter hongkongensis TaxID=168471 RepID=UPI001EFD8143|nr:flagellar filament capping protein FliD [Laribacter hongkongensis]MCG9032672.1 flagellar filament capping protein FliD [Laribacter hongkongensis]MCG9092630.1 flagellar filament capping protein FliD [Laribacter hongkongensis]
MAGLSIGGLGSGMDIDGMITKLMAIESRPLYLLQNQQKLEQTKLSAYGQLSSSLDSFKSAVAGLQDTSKLIGVKASVSGSDGLLSASASNSARDGRYTVQVNQLATSHKIASGTFADAGKEVVLAKGDEIKISVGSKTFNIKAESDMTLNDLADKINDAKGGVSANVVNDGSGYRLTLSSTDTGESNKITVAAVGTPTGAGVSKLVYVPGSSTTAPSATQAGETAKAQDAEVVIDGLKIKSASNILSTAIQGVTLTLTKADKDKPQQITVASDSGGVKTALDGMVKAYNDLMGTIKSLTSFDMTGVKPGEPAKRGPLNGDATVRAIQSQIRAAFSTPVEGAGSFKLMAEIGLSFDKDGMMTLDEEKLGKAVGSKPDDVLALFAATGKLVDGKAGAGVTLLESTGKTQAGQYQVKIEQAPWVLETSQASSWSSVSVPGASFKLKVNGVEKEITALELTGDKDADLAALNSKLKAVFADKVTANIVDGKLQFVAAEQSANSRVEITSADPLLSDFGIKVGVSPDKVSGTIGGHPAVGDGITLKGAVGTPIEGLKIQIDGGPLGVIGTLSFSKGMSYSLEDALQSMLDDKGLISIRKDGINSSIKSYDKQMEAMNTRLDATEARLRAQFNAMDSYMSQMSSLNSMLIQSLSRM